jgi:hypothetical protein
MLRIRKGRARLDVKMKKTRILAAGPVQLDRFLQIVK